MSCLRMLRSRVAAMRPSTGARLVAADLRGRGRWGLLSGRRHRGDRRQRLGMRGGDARRLLRRRSCVDLALLQIVFGGCHLGVLARLLYPIVVVLAAPLARHALTDLCLALL